jgi:hypothetical protein
MIVIGEVLVNGQSNDVWCNSKKPITDLSMYFGDSTHLNDSQYATMSSCYVLFCFADNMYLLVRPNNECMPSSKSVGEYFLCE